MQLSTYTSTNLPALYKMLLSQKYPDIKNINNETLPALGYIAHTLGQPVAAGFLRMVEGGFAQIDTLMTNADLPGALRHEGLTLVVDQLIAYAKFKGVKGLYAHTKSKDVIKRAKLLGFKILHQKIIILAL